MTSSHNICILPMYLWLLYASESALDNETSKFDGDICGYWKHVSMMVDSDAQNKYAHLSFVGKAALTLPW